MELDQLWEDLESGDAPKAHAALWTLAAAPNQAVAFLKDRLRQAPRVKPDRLQELIQNLNDERFMVREEASRELAELGIEAEAALRAAFARTTTLEVRRRIQALLMALSPQRQVSRESIRLLRVIQILEQIGSPPARQVLTYLAEGAPAAPETRAAKASVERLDQRRGQSPH